MCVCTSERTRCSRTHESNYCKKSSDLKLWTKRLSVRQYKKRKILSTERFSDVIEFHPEEEVFYFPGLFEGQPPHNRISTGYSERASMLRQYLLECFSNSSDKQFQTVKKWSRKLQSLWKAVLEENFVFSFRNALEVTSRFELDHRISVFILITSSH